jgi:hypothetical protein
MACKYAEKVSDSREYLCDFGLALGDRLPACRQREIACWESCSKNEKPIVISETKQYYVRAGRMGSESLVSLDAEGVAFAFKAGYDVREA